MAFWYRIKPSKLKTLSNQFKRCYSQIPGPCLANHIALRSTIRVLDKPTSIFHKSHIEFADNVRFFAAPVQAKPKQEEKKDASSRRLNEKITAEFVRIVINDEEHYVVSRREALERAKSLKLDLVEVQRNANPPVCKLMDYNREKYKQQLKEKDRAKSKSVVTLRKGDCKEVRFSGKTEQKDLQIKADTVKRLMDRGYRVKCMAMGTEEQDLGGLLSRLSALIEDVSVVESGPRVEKKQAYVIVRHVKFGLSKKGSGKKASIFGGATSPEVQKVDTSPPIANPSALNQFPIYSEETEDSAESGLETEDEILFEEAGTPITPSLEMADKYLDKKNPTWSPSEAQLETGNRYRREPRNIYPPTKSMDGKDTGARDSMRSVPQFSNQRRQPQFGLNSSPSTRETEQVETDASPFGNLKYPANDIPKQEQLHPGAPSFGIFSAPKPNNTSEKNGLPAEVNRYKKASTFDSTRHPRPRGVSASPGSPTLNSDSSGRPGVDNRGQGKWGIFSRESSNGMSSRSSDTQAKIE